MIDQTLMIMIVVAISALGGIYLLISNNKQSFKWWWLNFRYSFPLLGRLSSLSRNRMRDPSKKDWYIAERQLCSDYYEYLIFPDRSKFENDLLYLSAAGDGGKKPKGLSINLMLFLFMAVEGVAFGYLFINAVLPNSTENMYRLGSYFLGFAIAGALVYGTEKTGAVSALQKQWTDWKYEKAKKDVVRSPIDLNEDQTKDSSLSYLNRRANRFKDEPGKRFFWGAIVVIILIGVIALVMRGAAFKEYQTDQHNEAVKSSSSKNFGVQDFLNNVIGSMTNEKPVLPIAGQENNKKVEEANLLYKEQLQSVSGWFGIIGITIIYLAMQGIGMFVGARHSFFGQYSEQAYERTKGYSSYDELWKEYQNKKNIAVAKLINLHELMVKKNLDLAGPNENPIKTIDDYIEEQSGGLRSDIDRKRLIEKTLAEIDAKIDINDKKIVLGNLPKDIFDEVVNILRERNSSYTIERKQILDDLFPDK